MFRIGDAARLSGITIKLIRYYESVGLLRVVDRQTNGYRTYELRDVHELRFIKRARLLGFPIKEIKELLELWRNKQRRSHTVRRLAEAHLANLNARIRAFEGVTGVLERLINACEGNDRPDCPILDELGAEEQID
ncbi:MerR family DNA-binding protein [Hyphomicrobium sp.]|uniref:MerR family DNA-binding protein n=1 Tax=Hyphomicrobium sp. TaxID=82 RepID=UPI001E0FBE93|nr:MerR family DNA-binding protein [Hyphomicrobium sp.]MBY0560098.1 MerR family DNA-binding protein [Hyphomicrobium sp.]